MIKKILLVLILLIAGGVYYLMSNMESIVKKVVNKYGSEVTQTAVNLEGFDLSLKNGTATVKRITVANPKGYKTPNLFELDEVSVKVDLKSLTTDTIIIDKVEINKPVVAYEMLSLSRNNVMEVQNNVNAYTSKPSAEPKKAEAKSEGPGKKVIIRSLTVKGGELKAATNVAGLATPSATVKLPPIQMNGIGQNSGGTSVGKVIADVMTQILNTASTTALSSNISDLQNIANDQVDMAKGTVSDVKDTVKSIGDIFK